MIVDAVLGRVRVVVAVFAAVVVLVLARPVHASDRIAVVDGAQPEITQRLLAELRFLGFAPELVGAPASDEPAALFELARVHDVAAAIAIDDRVGHVQVWIVDRMTGKLVARELQLGEVATPREIAVRTVELLRASLGELEQAPPPPEAEVAVPEAARRTLRPATRSRLVLGAAGAVGGAPGGLGVLGHVRAQLRYAPHRNFGVVLVGTAPVHAARISAAEGRARVHTGWITAGPWFGLRRRGATVRPDLAATVGVALVGMEGDAAGDRVGRRALVVDAIVEVEAGLDVVLSPRVRLRVETAAAMCARTVRMRFSGRAVATWCRPHVLGSLGIGVALW